MERTFALYKARSYNSSNCTRHFKCKFTVTSSGITVSGDIVPTTPQGATLGTADKPFAELYIQSGSIHESDPPSDPPHYIKCMTVT
jgi:hypothetical protein